MAYYAADTLVIELMSTLHRSLCIQHCFVRSYFHGNVVISILQSAEFCQNSIYIFRAEITYMQNHLEINAQFACGVVRGAWER